MFIHGTMYSEWVSISATTQAEEKQWSVLHKLPGTSGRDVVVAVVKPLAANLGISTANCEPSNLQNDKEVQWFMEVICYGLGLPLSDHEAIRDCANVYCEWLLALTKPKVCVPKPVCDDPNLYSRKMLQHLYNLFLPRADSVGDIISRQAVLCHRVLRTIETVAQESVIIERETWNALLLFLLAINDTLLTPPCVQDDIGSHLCERILSVLVEVWLLACHRCFPSPPLWKTFREMCCSWRHRVALVDQWNHVNLALTARVIQFMYGPNFSDIKICDEGSHLVPSDMTNECVAQAWFRFLHTLGNPVDLCRPEVISQTPKFYHFALSSEMVIDPCQHPCLAVLPQIFLKSMKGIATLVDAFLGIAQLEEDCLLSQKSQCHVNHYSSATPPHSRRGITKSLASASVPKGSQRASLISGLTASKNISLSAQQQPQQTNIQSPIVTPTASVNPLLRPILSPSRPKVNSVLHLFGAWLFEASLVGSDLGTYSTNSDQADGSLRRPSSLLLDSRQNSTPSMPESIEIPSNLTLENFEAGQAEAIGALCRLFCAKRSGEEILPVYLARFYLAVQYGLSGGQEGHYQILSSILVNSCDLLRQDLDGVMVLVPHFLHALERVLPDRDMKIKPHCNIPQTELRHSSIHLLLSMLALPLHFGNLPIKDILAPADKPTITFQSLNVRLVNLLSNALQVETDSTNTHMLLGGLLLCIQDAAASEEVEQVTQPSTNDILSNEPVSSLFSDSDTAGVDGGEDASDDCETSSTYECSSLGPDLDSLLKADFPALEYDSTHALFLRATYLICHRLISSWKTDLNVSLAALEVLSGLARIHLPQADSLEGKRAVKWICDYIVFQCSRPPPAHSRDLHSTIVAAYQCVTTWLIEHPDLLEDKDTVHTILEVIELGISGTKSQSKASDPAKFKGDKELKPASMRVKDAAEAVLACMLDYVGYFPPPCGSENLSSLLDEQMLLQQCNSWIGGAVTKEGAVQQFRYFVTENSTVLAMLEQQLGNDQDPQPTVTALVRGPFGRYVWTMQLRHLPRHKSGSKHYTVNPGRPLPLNDIGVVYNVIPRYFPESVDRIPLSKADKSIPLLDLIISKQDETEHDKLSNLIANQIVFEENNQNKALHEEYPNPKTECTAPVVCQDFQTSRLILSHLGFLTLESLKESLTQPMPSLTALDQTQPGFHLQLELLDGISSRSSDTVFIFYVKSGQNSAKEILENVTCSKNSHPYFMEFLLSLGWPVDVALHTGWTGHVSTSWKGFPATTEQSDLHKDHGGSLYNGDHQVLYWSDASSEIAFVVPSYKEKIFNCDHIQKYEENDSSEDVYIRSKVKLETPPRETDRKTLNISSDESHTTCSDVLVPRTMSLNLDNEELLQSQGRKSGRKFGRHQGSFGGCDVKVLVVWLENLEDHLTFPLYELLPYLVTGLESTSFVPQFLEKDVFVIFIHALQSGLFRIKMQGPVGRMSLALPLVDGMVVSRRTLGTLVRQTALNLCRRRRLDAENCQPPHVRRRLKIQELASRFKQKFSEPEFYSSLFNSFSSN